MQAISNEFVNQSKVDELAKGIRWTMQFTDHSELNVFVNPNDQREHAHFGMARKRHMK